MLETLNYQSIIELIAIFIAVALPIALFFGFAVKMVNFFLSMAFGERQVKL